MQICITYGTYIRILDVLGPLPPEHGGILGANSHGIVTAFSLDEHGKSTSDSYAPHIASLNKLISEQWQSRGIHLMGMVHSHKEICTPSCGDIHYAARLLQFNNMEQFHLPIVTCGKDPQLHYYAVYRKNRQIVCKQLPYKIIYKGDNL